MESTWHKQGPSSWELLLLPELGVKPVSLDSYLLNLGESILCQTVSRASRVQDGAGVLSMGHPILTSRGWR